MLRRKTPQVNDNHIKVVESKQKQPFVPQGILVGKLKNDRSILLIKIY
jgi:hypothetical protein